MHLYHMTYINAYYIIYCRFLHIGPILTSFIHGYKSPNTEVQAIHNTHLFDPLNILPISNNETTVILCANALDHSIAATTMTLNTIMLRYGFQVNKIFHTI